MNNLVGFIYSVQTCYICAIAQNNQTNFSRMTCKI